MHKNTSDIFCLEKRGSDGNQIFSIGGSPSFRIRRQRELNTSVFPFGCMGNNKVAEVLIPSDYEPPVNILPEHVESVPVHSVPVHSMPPEMEFEEPRPTQPVEVENYHADKSLLQNTVMEPEIEPTLDNTLMAEQVEEPEENPERYVNPPCFQHKALSARNPLTGEGIELPSAKRGKRPPGQKQPKWTW